MHKKFSGYIIFLGLLLFFSNSHAGNNLPVVKEGVIDLSDYNFEDDGNIGIHGTWKFFWSRLLDEKQALSDSDFCYLKVPKSWGGQIYKNQVLPVYGYGTYYVKIILGKKYRDRIFLFKSIYIPTSSALFINGKLVGNNGKVSSTKEESKPDVKINLDEFSLNADTLHLIIQASNYHVQKSGIYYNFELGLAKKITRAAEIQTAVDLFITGGIFLMMLYFFVFFLLRKKEKSALYFALSCLMIFIYSLCITNVFTHIFPDNWFQGYYKLKHISIYLAFLTISLYIHDLFKLYFSKLILKIIVVTCIVFTAVMLIFNSNLNAFAFSYFRFVGLTSVLYFIFVIIKARIKKTRGSGIFILCIAIIFLSILNDTLYNIQVIKTTDILPFGLFLFLIVQTYLLSSRFNRSFRKTEELSQELTYINKNLEKIVEERTQEIAYQKKEIEEKNEELNQLLEEVTAQRDEISAQRDMVTFQKNKIEVIHHELSQSIDYAKRIQSSILSDECILKNHLSDHFILFLPKDKVSGDFYWWYENDGNLLLTVADCTGHGVPGSFMSMLGISFLREIIIKEYVTHPGIILKRLRKEIINVLKQKGEPGEQKDGMDMTLIAINLENKTMQFSGANNPIYFIRNGELTEYKGDKMPIAIYEKMDKFSTTEIQLQKGDQIYLFSDGFADQFGGPDIANGGKKLKYKPFKELLIANNQLEMKEQKTLLEQRFKEWQGIGEQTDDVTVLGIRI